MNVLSAIPASEPTELYRLRDGIYAADLLTAGIAHLDFFTWLAGHPSTLGAICVHFGIQVRPADVMLTLFSAMGLVTQSGGCFHVTLRAREHLVKGSPWYMGPYYAALKERPQTLDMLKVLKSGRPANWGSYDAEAWVQAMEKPEFAGQFTAAMDARGVLLGQALAQRLELGSSNVVLDVAGGSGIYSCALVHRHQHLRAVVFEKSPVDGIARKAIEERGYSGKVSVVSGDMFVDRWPDGADVHLVSNVLHDWDEPRVRQLLARSHAALPEEGLLIIHDCHLNVLKTGPLPVANYSVLLMHSSEGKCYSQAEMRVYLSEAGFEWVDFQPTLIDRSYIVARKM